MDMTQDDVWHNDPSKWHLGIHRLKAGDRIGMELIDLNSSGYDMAITYTLKGGIGVIGSTAASKPRRVSIGCRSRHQVLVVLTPRHAKYAVMVEKGQ